MPGDFDFDDEPAKPAPRPKVEPLEESEPRPRRRSDADSRNEHRHERTPPGKSSFSPLLIAAMVIGGLLVVGGSVALVFAFRAKDPETPKGPIASTSGTTSRPVVTQPKGDPTNLSEEMEKKVRKATVRVLVQLNDGKGASGTGFVEKNSRLVVTNAHVIGALKGEPGPDIINLVVNSGEGKDKEYHLGAEVLAVDPDHDLALLAPKIIEIGERHIVPDGIVVPKSLAIRERQRLFVFGYPFGSELGKEITIGETAISSLRKNDEGKLVKIQVQGGLNPGNSGGPLVDSKGNLVGVAVSIIKGTDLNFAIPGDIVQEFITKHRK